MYGIVYEDSGGLAAGACRRHGILGRILRSAVAGRLLLKPTWKAPAHKGWLGLFLHMQPTWKAAGHRLDGIGVHVM